MPKKRRALRRTIFRTFLLVCIGAITGGIVWLHQGGEMAVSHPLIAHYAGEKINKLLNASCTVDKAFISPLGTITLRTVTIRRTIAPRCIASVCFSRVAISFRLFPVLRNFKAVLRAIRGKEDSRHWSALEDFHLLESVYCAGGKADFTCNGTTAARLIGADCRMRNFDTTGLPHRLDFRFIKAMAGSATIDSLITSLRLPPSIAVTAVPSDAFAMDNDGGPRCKINMRTITLRREIAPGCSALVSFRSAKAACRFFPVMIRAREMLHSMNRSVEGGFQFNCSDAFRSLQHWLGLLTDVQLLSGIALLTRNDTIAAQCRGVDCRISGFNPAGLPRSMNFRARTVGAGHVGIDSAIAFVHFLSSTAARQSLPLSSGGGSWGLRLKMRAPHVKIDSIGAMDSVSAVVEFGAADDPLLYLSTILFKDSHRGPIRTKLQLTARELRTGRISGLKGISILSYLHGDTMEVRKGSGNFNSARIEVAGRYSIGSGQLAYGKIDVRGLDIGTFYQSLKNKPGHLSGTADITLNLYAGRLRTDLLRGNAVIKATNVFARNLPVQGAPVLQRYLPDFNRLTFSTIDGDARFSGRSIEIRELWAHGDPLNVIISGAMDLDANMKLRLYGWLPEWYVKTLPLTVRESLVHEPYDNYSFHCSITGTFINPDVTLDRSHYVRAITGVLAHFGKSIFKLFNSNSP